MRYRLFVFLLVWASGLGILKFSNAFLNVTTYDELFRQRFSAGYKADPRIVLLGLDENAMLPENFHRARHSEVLTRLTELGVRLVFYDIVFDEDRGPEMDGPLLKALMNGPSVVLAGTFSQGFVPNPENPNYEIEATIPPKLAPALLPAVEKGPAVLASIEQPTDEKGNLSLYFMGIQFDSELDRVRDPQQVPSAALASYSLLQSVRPSELVYKEDFIEVPPLKVPITQKPPAADGVSVYAFDLKFHTPATGPGHQPGPDTYQVIPYLDILERPEEELIQSLKDKIVFIGENTQGPTDVFQTPVGPMKGFEAHAQCLDRLLNEAYFTKVSEFANFQIAAALLALVASMAFLTWPLWGLMLGGALLLGGQVYLNLWLYDQKHLVIDLLAPSLSAAFAFGCLILFRVVLTSQLLARFIPKEAVQAFLTSNSAAQATNATVIVTDIRGYTSLSETRTPSQMLELLNEYHSVTVDIYHKHGGNVLTFQGDAQLVVFGYPKKLRDPVGNAVKASLEVGQAIDELRTKWGITERKNFDVGAGICTGLVYIGDIGSKEQANYTVIGEVVRTSHKVQSMSDILQGNLLMDEPSYKACRSKPVVTEIPGVMLEGFPDSKTLYRVERQV